MTNAEMNKMELKSSIENTAEQFERVKRLMRDYADKMADVAYRIRTEDPSKQTFKYTRADMANAGINDIENMLRNVNFSQIARYASRLEMAEKSHDE